MSKYLFAYHGGAMASTPEEQEASRAAWFAWFGELGPAIAEGGAPVAAARTVGSDGVSDGAGANPVSGYSVIEASSLDDACAKAAGCPVLSGGGSVEVAELIDIEM